MHTTKNNVGRRHCALEITGMNLLQSAHMVKRLTDRAYFEKGLQQFERIYEYDGKHFVLAGIGTNGFIVSA